MEATLGCQAEGTWWWRHECEPGEISQEAAALAQGDAAHILDHAGDPGTPGTY